MTLLVFKKMKLDYRDLGMINGHRFIRVGRGSDFAVVRKRLHCSRAGEDKAGRGSTCWGDLALGVILLS